jgi:hypothetical protein
LAEAQMTRPGTTPNPDPTERTIQQLLREIAALRELVEAKITAGDEMSAMLAKGVDAVPGLTKDAVGHLKELHGERFNSFKDLLKVQLDALSARITEQGATQKTAVDAAFLASQKVADVTNENNKAAAAKSESNFSEALKQLMLLTTKMDDNTKAVLTDIKERQDRGEGRGTGRGEIVGYIFGGVGVLAAFVAIFVAFAPHGPSTSLADSNAVAISKLIDLNASILQRLPPK